MTATLLQLPDPVRDRAAASEVIRCSDATRDQLLMACDVLSMSPDWMDIVQAREVRNALWANVASELRPEAAALAGRLGTRTLTSEELSACGAGPGLGRMAQHFETLKPARKRLTEGQKTRLAFGIVIAALVVACAVNIALAAPGKIVRTVALHQEISQ